MLEQIAGRRERLSARLADMLALRRLLPHARSQAARMRIPVACKRV